MPTGTRVCKVNPPAVILNISSEPLGVFTANSMAPSGEIEMGRTCPLSNSTKDGPLDPPETEAGKNSRHASAQRTNNQKAGNPLLTFSFGQRTPRTRKS